MPMLFALLLASVTLSPPFGQAEARAVDVRDDGMTLEVEVEVQQSALVVLVRGVGSVDELPPVAASAEPPPRRKRGLRLRLPRWLNPFARRVNQ